MSKPQLKLLVIRAADMERAVEFYRCLGIDFAEERHGGGPRHFAADLEGTIFEVYPAKTDEDVDRTTRLGFSVLDLPGTMARLGSLGARTAKPPQKSPWGVRAVVKDPDGRAVELYEADATAAFRMETKQSDQSD